MIKKTRRILFVIGVLMFICLFVGMKSPMSAFADDSTTDTALSQAEKNPPAVEGYQDPSDDEGEYAPSEEDGQEYIESEEDMSSEDEEPADESEEAPPEE